MSFIIDKAKLERNFNLASSSYEDMAYVQEKSAIILTDMIWQNVNFAHSKALLAPASILDVGCGSGYVTEILLNKFPKSSFTINDIAQNMLELANNKINANFSNVRINNILGDMDFIEFTKYDLIVSNMAFQWSSNLENLIKKMYSLSKIFAFSCPVKDTFQEWSNLFSKENIALPTYVYNSDAKLKSICEKIKLENIKNNNLANENSVFKVKNFKLNFDSAISFAKYLKKLGANTPSKQIDIKDIMRILKMNNRELTITYKIFFALMINN